MAARFILIRVANGSAVALLLDRDPQGAWVQKWRTSRRRFAKPSRIGVAEIIGDASPNDPRRIAAEQFRAAVQKAGAP